MSPEQARGKSVDRRTDIWSFGCVLFEMLSGRRAFDGETVTDVLAAVVTRDPDWSLIPAHTPARIRELLRRCLEKDAQRRLRDAGEIRIAVEDAIARPQSGAMEAAAPVAAAGPRHERRRVWPWIVLAAMAFIVVMTLIDDDDAPRTPPTRLSVVLAPTDLLDGGSENLMLNISRDGRTVAYAARRDANTALFVRHFGDGEATRLTGTEDAHSPFFSPDGKWIAFVAQSKLRKVSVGGGPVFDICDVSVDRSGVWLDDGSIIVSTHATVPLMRVSSSGGALQAVTALDTANGERTHRWPDALPGSEWVIFTVGAANSPGNYEDAAIDAASLRTGERRRLVERASMARYCEPGYLVFSRRGALFAARIDPSDPKLTGPSVPILDRVDREPSSGAVHFAVARNGTLVFAPRLEASDHFEMVWITHDGATTLIPAPPNEYSSPRISPDGRQICVVIGHAYGQGDLWRLDLARETLTRLTFDATNVVGYWTPDGRHIVYQSENVAFNVSILPLDGDAGEKRIFSEKQPHMITGLTPDGRTVLMAPWGKSDGDILSLPIEGGEPRVVVKEPFDQADAVVSPDGKWIAYDSRATGTLEVFVRSYPPGESRWQISSGGGMMPAWSPTRRELYWIQNNAIFAAVYVAGDRTISFDRAHKLFDMPPRRDADVNPYDISPDGSRFLMTRTARPEFARRRIDVVLGFDAMLRDLNRKTAVE
jgi:serine/threonine-protein kinase